MSLRIEREERVLHITLNRPEKRNALTIGMCAELVKSTDEVQDDPNIGSILIDAEGTVFSAGMDLEEAANSNNIHRLATHERLFTLGANSKKPIVICVKGPALGGGMGLAVQGHVVVAAQGALFALTEIRIGLWPFLVYRCIEAAIGPRRAMEMSLTGRAIATNDALDWGIVQQVTPQFEADDRAAAVARDLAWSSPVAISAGLDYVREARGKNWAQQGELAVAERAKVLHGTDFKEGVRAFKEHRAPCWPSMPEGSYDSVTEPAQTPDAEPEAAS
ncbi:MAG: enoyl-CoA hydratase/isomerase family protein [Bryobacteraceae bacterium]